MDSGGAHRERRADYGYARGVDIERDEVGAAAEVDGPADGCSDQAPCRLSRAKPNAAPFSPRPAMDDRDELRGRVPPKRDFGAVSRQTECCLSGSATLYK
jgi:hypothetical protein